MDLAHGGHVDALLALEVVGQQAVRDPAARAISPTVTSAYGRRENSARAAASSFRRLCSAANCRAVNRFSSAMVRAGYFR
ncbi:hypothetical protein GCM10029964_118170 [Kibdelosporangium lantanae]